MLIGALVVTNEFFHQTATATFMTNPHRTAVIMAKLAAAIDLRRAVLVRVHRDGRDRHTDLPAQSARQSFAHRLDRGAIGPLNLLAFVMWAIFGLGLGTLIRSQIGSVVTGMAVYLIGFAAVELIFHLIYHVYHHCWSSARRRHRTRGRVPGHDHPAAHLRPRAPQWAGLLVMIGYALLIGGIGIALTRRRDVT